MSRKKIVDEDEARHLLLTEGWTYQQMIDLYLNKYGIETSRGVWQRFLKGEGARRAPVSLPLAVPWVMRDFDLKRSNYRTALRALAKIEQGEPVSPEGRRLAARLRRILGTDKVVDYDREENALVVVPRRGVDKWWIRDPFLNDDGSLVADFSRVRAAAVAERFNM